MRSIHRLCVVAAILLPACALAQNIEVSSPSGVVKVRFAVGNDGRLTWTALRGDAVVIEPSPAGITVEGIDLGDGVSIEQAATGTINEEYPWRGIKSVAVNRCRTSAIRVIHKATKATWTLEARAFDDGIAFRYRIPGAGQRRIDGEATAWTLPAESWAWFQTDTEDYEGEYHRQRPEQIPLQTTEDNRTRATHLGPPVTVELPGGVYALISEANLLRYSGMTLRPTGTRTLKAAFEDDPRGFVLDGEIVTPWRVTVVAGDLQALATTDIFPNLCDKPDPAIFPDGMRTKWIKPGRALVTWCVFGNDGAQWDKQKWFVDKCADMKCEYLLVDGGWRSEKWGYRSGGADEWARLRELCEYGAQRNVDIVVWNSFPEGRNDGPGITAPAARREFMRRVKEAGAKGVKIDFFNAEGKATVDAMEDLLRLSAEHRLNINFHGANKPTGLVRTFPHQVTQEGIREQEYLLWDKLPREHYAALPFTRFVAGHADFLPTYVRTQYLKNTTATHQLATAIIANSSFLCWPDHPDDYLKSPLIEIVRAMPVVWDETRVLDGTRIGQVVAFARRAGDAWYVGVVNGQDQPAKWSTDLSFLPAGACRATLYRDKEPGPAAMDIAADMPLERGRRIDVHLPPGGGFVAWIRPRP